MEERPTRATLVSAADLGDGVATVISKSEIEAALASDGEPIELVLDIARHRQDGESRSVPVSWERFDLERLLEQVKGDEVDAHLRPGGVVAGGGDGRRGARNPRGGRRARGCGDRGDGCRRASIGISEPGARRLDRRTRLRSQQATSLRTTAQCPGRRRCWRPRRIWLQTTGPFRGPRLWRYRRRTSLRTIGPCRGRLRSRRRRRTSLRTTGPYRGRRRSRHLPRIWLQTTGQCHGRRRLRRPRRWHVSAPDIAPDDRASAAAYPRCTAGYRNGVRRDVLGANSGRDRRHRRCDRIGHRRRVLPRRRAASPTASGLVHG